MKFTVIKILLVLAFVGTIFGGATLYYFNARSEGDNIRLEWKTQDESNVKTFVVERKTPQSSFVEVATIQPKGSNSVYTFVDEATYKATDLVFTYRIKIVDYNNPQPTYSVDATVSHNISGVKRTWGSIKAMFR